MLITLLLLCFLLGCVNGLRAFTAPAAVSWAAHLGWLHLAGTRLAFVGSRPTLIVLTLLALCEYVIDKLPNTPPRTQPRGLIPRLLFAGLCGASLATSAGQGWIVPGAVAIIGVLVGTFAGYNIRHALVTRALLPDFPVALAEDMIAISASLLIVSRM
jgi:uncharacterized membrane protein